MEWKIRLAVGFSMYPLLLQVVCQCSFINNKLFFQDWHWALNYGPCFTYAAHMKAMEDAYCSDFLEPEAQWTRVKTSARSHWHVPKESSLPYIPLHASGLNRASKSNPQSTKTETKLSSAQAHHALLELTLIICWAVRNL